MRASQWLTEVVVTASIRVRNRSWNTIDISNMIVFVVTLLDLSYELITCHVGSGEIIVKTFISSGAGFAGYRDSFWHMHHPFCRARIHQLCIDRTALE